MKWALSMETLSEDLETGKARWDDAENNEDEFLY